MNEPPQHRWTLESARALLGDVRDRTAAAVEEVEGLLQRRDATPDGTPERAEVEDDIQEIAGRWARAMDALGLEVQGPWLVDFDNGEGYYCWKWPEETLDHFHGYDEGFAGRIRIQ
ncbi:MAG: DUF2203 family protein [Myxococcales bacterium]|nr:DUF2203 family protein [Myxococcales bacterium]